MSKAVPNLESGDSQELVSIMAVSQGLVLMAPPAGNIEAQTTMAALLSAIKPKTKVRSGIGVGCFDNYCTVQVVLSVQGSWCCLLQFAVCVSHALEKLDSPGKRPLL